MRAGPACPAVIADAFRSALTAAERVVGATAPNPPVGCVVLDEDGVVLACEAHQKAGAPHAEAAAVEVCRRAGVAERIHAIVVTLEPCNHQGRTPPCTDIILSTPARSVWVGVRDPNPKVRGGGAAELAARGLKLAFIDTLDHPDAPTLAAAAERLIAPFRTWSQSGRPWLTLKQAVAADGGMTPPAGRNTFTSEASLRLAHGLRRRADAIITGSGCVLADDPQFTVRLVPDHAGKRRKLAILDRRGRTPPDYVRAAQARGFDVLVRGDVEALLAELAAAGVVEALVEAGPTLLGTFRDQGLWDEQVIIRQSPIPGQPDSVDVRTRSNLG
ncbi:MAG TPA: bifunctional diaminohydroxyphosphoribosylaminopyrimidine deaminase/5-amino-6-(5-phosphoribosylamino)uracil reductase RibD [Caulobacteraceae bacterium]|nr:bifunctional diaminohydroxyphosphoribosylaminopyrimidine deaminase/5-amino-6-(5-phosphoribosylamino)uracil reductase RibD [Caulobacteraceae bacterium]